jgi:hypothetical protein
VATPDARRTASYHTELVVPEEVRIGRAVLFDERTRRVHARDDEVDRGALHATGLPLSARPRVLFTLRLERTGLPVRGFAVSWVATLLLGFGAGVADLDVVGEGPAVSVLLAASAVFAGAVAGSGEHRLVVSLFAGPRVLLAVSALSALAAAGALAFGARDALLDAIWLVCAALASVSSLLLTLTLARARAIAPAAHPVAAPPGTLDS